MIPLAVGACESSSGRPHDPTQVRVYAADAPDPPSMAATPPTAPPSVAPAPVVSRYNEDPGRFKPAAPIPSIPANEWRQRWPYAASDLAAWAARFPAQAAALFAWDSSDSARAETFLRWVVDNPYDNFNAYLVGRHGWGADVLALHRPDAAPAMQELLEMVRRSPRAWLELAQEPQGLAWVSEHWNGRASPPRSVQSMANEQKVR